MSVRSIILLLLSLTWETTVLGQEVQKGSVDLSSFVFQSTPTFELNGDWRFAPSEFVSPLKSQDLKTYKQVPQLWENPIGYSTYGLKILMPQNRPKLGIQVPDIYSSYQLTINGHYADFKGYAADNRDNAIPYRMIKVIPIPEEYDSIEVVVHVSNYRHHKGGIGKPVIIGDLIYLERWAFLSRTFDAFIGGSLMVAFFFFLGLYLYGRHDKTSLFFAVFCFTYAIRVCFSGNHMINRLIPSFPWDLQIRIEYASLYLTTIFFGYFVYYLFPEKLSKFFINGYTIIAIIFVPLVIFTPPYYFTQFNIIHLTFMLIGIVIITFIFLRSVFKREEGSIYSLLSITGFLIILTTKSLDYFNILNENLLVTFMGQIIFFLSHALVLSNHFSSSWRKAKENAEASAETKSNFLSVMSHEIRTPLNSVIGTTHHLIENNPSKRQKSDLVNLKVSSENLLHIVNNILDFNKIDSDNIKLEVANIKLEKFIHDLADQARKFAEEKGLELGVEVDDQLPVVQIDETRLTQILSNLLNNALKFTDKGGVRVKVELVETKGDKNYVRFSVTDTGIGIKEEDIDVILDPFKQVSSSNTRKYAGTGLGLSITEKLVKLMGAKLEIYSSPGKGSSFFFTLILNEGRHEEIKIVKDEVKDLSKVRILLVDDHDLNVLMTKNFLEKWNATVEVANDGRQAIGMTEKELFDVILMDIQMPGMDGFEASMIIRKNGFIQPIIAITADPYQETKAFEQAGINARVIKPFDPQHLYSTIKSHINPD